MPTAMSSHERRMYARISERAVATTFTINYSDARDSLVCALVDDLATNPLALQYYDALRLLHYALDDIDQTRRVIRASVDGRAIDDSVVPEVVLHCVVAAGQLLSALKPRTKDFGFTVIGTASMQDMLKHRGQRILRCSNRLKCAVDEGRTLRLD